MKNFEKDQNQNDRNQQNENQRNQNEDFKNRTQPTDAYKNEYREDDLNDQNQHSRTQNQNDTQGNRGNQQREQNDNLTGNKSKFSASREDESYGSDNRQEYDDYEK